jgi:hypothetical protein
VQVLLKLGPGRVALMMKYLGVQGAGQLLVELGPRFGARESSICCGCLCSVNALHLHISRGAP